MSLNPKALLPLAGPLRATFQDAGFTVDGVADLLGPRASAALGRHDLVPALAASSGDAPLEVLVRLFLLGCDGPTAATGFLPSQVLEDAGPGLVRAALDIRPHEDDWWVAADIARRHPPAADHVIGIGAASMTLVSAALRRPVRCALDIGTGCGIQALHLTRRAGRVTATDSVPRALEMARLTFALSGFAPGTPDLRLGDFFAPVAGEQFDLIVSNPPFVLAPPDPDTLAYRDNPDPDGGLATLLAGAFVALAPGGVAQLLTSWVIGPGGDWRERVADALPGGCDALVLLREELDPAEHVALWRDEDEPEPAATDRALRWLAHLDALGAAGVAYGLVLLRRTDREPVVRFVDVSGDAASTTGRQLGGWLDRVQLGGVGDRQLRVADGVRLQEELSGGSDGWAPSQRWLTSPDALPQTVSIDPVTRALLDGLAGELPTSAVAEILALATGAPADGVLRAAQALFESGHLTLQDAAIPHESSVLAPGSR